MWRILTVCFIGLTGVALSAPGPKDAPKKDSLIVGDWRILSIDGQKEIPSVFEFRTDGNVIISTQFGTAESSFRYEYEVAEKATPARIDICGHDLLEEGIFKIEGDRLTICLREGRGKRPKEFGEKGARLEVFERIKPKD
jgi:uncharacterized protein (TIGR03067 family)